MKEVQQPSPLATLAEAVGLQADWSDATGQAQKVEDEHLARVLAALGYPADSEKDIEESLARVRQEERAATFLSIDVGDDLLLTADQVGQACDAELTLEDGTTHALSVKQDGSQFALPTAAVTQTGYHRLRLGTREFTLAIAPRRCFTIADAAQRSRGGGRKLWGAAAQIPSLRDEQETGFGGFGTLAEAARALARQGADALAISPAHALFPADVTRFSPYAPSSRLFLNILYADPRLVGAEPAPGSQGELVDWEQAIPAQLAALRKAFASRSGEVKQQVAAYRAKAGAELEHHAIYDALHAHFFDTGAGGWQGWPKEYHDPEGEAVQRFAQEHSEEVEFFLFAQWLAKASLDAAQQAAKDAGMAIGLISDLAVGMDSGGSHGWSRPNDLLTGLSIGAPPDLLGPQGQDWGITSFAPQALRRAAFAAFIGTLRAALDHAGGIRIDHILGLRRLWVIPHGSPSPEGAYLTYPLDDMLRILAIESERAQAIIVGEDLGTVPEGLRPKLAARAVYGMNVLFFERDEKGAFTPPAEWREEALAMTGTHDLPTVSGWWHGRDIDWAWKLGRSGADSEDEDRRQRQEDRGKLWQAFRQSGAATGRQPDAHDSWPVLEAAAAHVGSSPCELTVLPLEDLLGLDEQPNLPGTMDEHPNWRRRIPEPLPDLLEREEVARRAQAISKARR
jgi:4-alpha-glucanotransferase